GARLADAVVSVQIDLLVFDRSPDALDEDVVAPRALAIHADGDSVCDKHAGEGGAGELTSLIGVENLRCAVFGQRFLQRLDAELRLHGDREPPGQNPAAEPVDDGGEIDEAARHRDVGDVHRPDLVGTSDLQPAQKIGENL